ncbi:MAG: FAD-dependent monooxygenase [Planctomycetota bacterium]|nr:MAG: FAD-dependent monooxygenase [Planctomycetota bacterium]
MSYPADNINNFNDVIIIGGGPAGCATALHLLRLDPQTAKHSILLEKSFHPRQKVCGGALTINAEKLLAELDIEVTVPQVPIHHSRFVYGRLNIDLAEDGVAKKVIRRSEFDTMLINTVKDRGFKVLEGVKAIGVTRQANGVLVHTNKGDFGAKAVVGADGVGGLLRKTPGFGPRDRVSRLWMVEVPADPEKTPIYRDRIMHVDFSYASLGVKGYYWEFPCLINGKPYTNRGLVEGTLDKKSRIDGKKLFCEILERRGVSVDGLPILSHPLRPFNPKETFSQPRLLLAGDAIGADPLFSEGISQALSMGRLAAYTLVDGFKHNDLSFLNYTKQVLNSRVGREMKVYMMLSKYVWGRLFEPFLSVLHADTQMRDLFAYSYGGTKDIFRSKRLLAKATAKHMLFLWPRLRRFRRLADLQASALPDLSLKFGSVRNK